VPAHVYTVNVYYESLQLTRNMHKAKDNGHRVHGQKEIKHAYGPKSTPIAQGLVDDINAMHAYGRSSAPIAHELVYDINEPLSLRTHNGAQDRGGGTLEVGGAATAGATAT